MAMSLWAQTSKPCGCRACNFLLSAVYNLDTWGHNFGDADSYRTLEAHCCNKFSSHNQPDIGLLLR